jgi:hypothetical protein
MPFLVTKQASSYDIFLCGRTSIFVCFKMFASTSKTSGLAKSNFVFGSEFKEIVRPHRLAAVKAATGLTYKSDGTGFYK